MAKGLALSILLGTLAVDHAAAVPISITAGGTVTQVLAPDAFGTAAGDQIAMRVTFDTNDLVDVDALFGISVPGVQFASLAGPASSLFIQLGARTWTELNEPLLGSDYFGLFPTALPHVVLVNGQFAGLNYFGIGPGDDVFINDAVGQLYFGAPLGQLFGGNSDPDSPPFWIGQWDFGSVRVNVAEPETGILMLIGLLGLLYSLQRNDNQRSRGQTPQPIARMASHPTSREPGNLNSRQVRHPAE